MTAEFIGTIKKCAEYVRNILVSDYRSPVISFHPLHYDYNIVKHIL